MTQIDLLPILVPERPFLLLVVPVCWYVASPCLVLLVRSLLALHVPRSPCRDILCLMQIDPDVISKNMLFAVPKKGRLFDKVKKLLEGIGLDYHRVR